MVDTPAAPAAPATSPAAPAAPAAPAVAPAAPTEPVAFDWSKSGLDADHVGYVQNKGFKDPAAPVVAYRNLEKLMGVPAEQILKLPSDDLPTSWDPIYSKLGRPEKPDGYKLPVPEGADPTFSKSAAEAFHKAGVSQKQAEALTTWWNEQAAGVTKAQSDAAQARDTEQLAALKNEWGVNLQANSVIVDKAATAFGMTTAQLDGLKAAMGPGEAMKFLHNIGSKLATEDAFIGADGKPSSTGGLTPAQAVSKIAELRKDGEFVKRYSAGEMAAKSEMARLHQIAYPQG
jgi:hypothetical protein